LLVFFSLAVTSASFGALGGDATSVQADQAHMRAQVRVTRTNAYTLHELQVQGKVAVREYVSPVGKVFAVAWSGPTRPDLQQVLGTYYSQFSHAMQQRRARGPVNLRLPGLVVQMGGHQRALRGRAYVPEMMPDSVTPQEIN
jgi:Protein of unknown function (DUF2844)